MLHTGWFRVFGINESRFCDVVRAGNYAHPGKAIAVATLALGLIACAGSPQEKSARWVKSAQAALNEKKFSVAIVDLQNAIQATPKNADAHYLLGMALLNSGQQGRALRSFSVAVDLQPTHVDSHLQIAELLNAASDPKMFPIAEQHAQAALEQRQSDPEILHSLAVAEWRQKKTETAVEHLKKALKVLPTHGKSAATLAFIQASEQRNVSGAEQTLRNLVEQSTGSAEALVTLGRFYSLIGRPQEAEKQLREAIGIDPTNGPALLEIARLQQSQGRKAEAEQLFRRLSSLPDKSYRPLHASFLFENGEHEAAIAELKSLWTNDPKNADLRSRLVDFYLQTNKLTEADSVLSTALRQSPRDADARQQQARLYIQQRRFQDAETSIKHVLQLRPESAPAHYLLAQAHRGLGRTRDYRRELEVALERDPNLLDARVELSQSLRNSRALREAFDVIDGAPLSQKQELAIVQERTWILLALGRYAAAKPDVEKALSTSRDPASLLQAGLLAVQEKRHAAGRALFEEVLQGAPENIDALNAIIASFISERNAGAAIQRLQKHAAQFPGSARAHFTLGVWLERTGDLAGARSAYGAALAAESSYTPAIIASARMQMLQGRGDTARASLEAVLKKNPREVDALLALGMLKESSGGYEEAIQAYRSILQLEPAHVVAKNNLTVLLSEKPATVDEALVFAQQLKQAVSDNPDIDDTVGWVYFKKGLYSTAIQHFERAAARSNDARVKYHLAMAYFASGNQALGQKSLAVARQMNPDLPEAELARKLAESAKP